MQFDLDFSQKLPVSAQIGMQQADENADPQWKHIYDGCVLAAARKKSTLTSDDVLTELESLPNPPKTHNLSAIGPAMKRAFEMGILEPTEGFVRSDRPKKKGNLHRLWRSKVYAKNSQAETR